MWQRDCKVTLDFHRSVSDQAAAHLNIFYDNTFKKPWLVAKLLPTDKALAKISAVALVRHLVTTRPWNRTFFEHRTFTHGEVWENLEVFSNAELPVLLLGNHGQYESLFKLIGSSVPCGP